MAEDNLPGRKCTEIGPIEVSVKKLTIFHQDPTKEQANLALIEKARALGADAVIRVTCEIGIGFTTWGYIDAKGTAV
ncbi:heavy metal-binding domain-containing protein [Ideonella sp. A 288]|uniref:heavy metal-binding domain-containing protein n=1 Tax=Ideonella sp. A 288 TaxID=1962181 RepID=UPI000B4AB0B6|nr:heavy metal-binding domain-containing protein [Ideonella sp. A 288]